MGKVISVQEQPVKVIILAAAQGRAPGVSYPRALQKLAGRAIIDYVIEWAQGFAQPEDIFVVVGYQHEEVERHLGPWYRYILQHEPLGTGHAVLQVAPYLKDFDGNLLILYGDTPLFRFSSLKGLLTRHCLKGADLTLFSCITDQDLPYGRIVRDEQGRVVDVVENVEASDAVRAIRELNLGAYVARSSVLFSALQQVERRDTAEGYPLTAVVSKLVSQGRRVETYRTVDQDEVRGINTREDLEAAELILKKRVMRPRRLEEENVIHFGTGGWRAIIGEGFTLHNVRRLCQAIANRIVRQDRESLGVLIGYDHRFLSDMAAEAAAEVFAGNDISVTLLPEAAPTPLITYATMLAGAAYGLAFTASHNPPEWNGLKVFASDGSLLLDQESQAIEQEANALTPQDIIKIELDLAKEGGLVQIRDFTNQYVDAVESLIDRDLVREAGLRVLVDPMYGVAEITANIILTEMRCRVATIHGRRDPLFGGRSPAPDLDALGLLIHQMQEGDYDLGMAMDGDADRIAIVDERGQYVPVNELLVLLYWYLYEVRGQKGPVVRNLATTHMLDRLARVFGEQVIEVPVGFKHVAEAMQRFGAVLGGESSGGLTIRGHILGKDGILAASLIVEMLARTKQRISVLLANLFDRIGRLYTVEENIPATPEMRVLVPRLLEERHIDQLAGLQVRQLMGMDGFKFVFDQDQWLLLRFSGTEPLLRIFAEAASPEKARELVEAARALLPSVSD